MKNANTTLKESKENKKIFIIVATVLFTVSVIVSNLNGAM